MLPVSFLICLGRLCKGAMDSRVPDYLQDHTKTFMDERYQQYFEKRPVPVLLPSGHLEFRTFQEEDMASQWGFFILPKVDKDIVGPASIVHQHSEGEGVLSFSKLID